LQQEVQKKSVLAYPQIFLIIACVYGFSSSIPVFLLSLGFSMLLLLSLRATLGATTLLVIYRSRLFGFNKPAIKWGLICGLFNLSSMITLIYAIVLIGPATTSVFLACGIVLIPFANWIVNRSRPKPINLVAAVLCAGGLVLALMQTGISFSFGWGQALGLANAVFYAFFVVLLNRASKTAPSEKLNFIQLVFMALVTAVLFFCIDFSSAAFSADMIRHIWVIVFLGVITDGVVFLFQTKAQGRSNPNISAIYLYTFALFAVVFSILLGFDDFRWQLVAGAGIVFVAAILPNVAEWIKAGNKK